jgi:hypothetical protein
MANNWKIENSITRIMLSVFMDCLIDQNYKGLVLEGAPPQDEIEKAWEDVREQYIDAIGNPAQKFRLGLITQLKFFELHLNSITIGLNILKYLGNPESLFPPVIREHIEKWKQLINDLFIYNYSFNPDDQAHYNAELENAFARSKGSEMTYKLKKIELEDLDKKISNSNKNEKPTRELFESNITNIMIHYNINISSESISTYRYCDLIKKINRQSKTQTPKHATR